MYKKFNIRFSILLILLATFFSTISIVEAKQTISTTRNNEDVNLVTDSLNTKTLPKRFRKTSDLTDVDNNNLNLKGLNTLNISGSQQFSAFNLPLIINSIGNSKPITIVDLRQESHGFINGIPVSWKGAKNNANQGLTMKEVLSDEAAKLASIKLGEPITFYNHPDMKVIVESVQSENQLVNSKSLSYLRVPVTDGKIPTDEMVDYFVQWVKKQPKDIWLHFHCKEGIGRTTTFMAMYDMMKNSKEVTADDIIKRQVMLANFKKDKLDSFTNNERGRFLKSFYEYCKENSDSFDVKWSDWKKTHGTNNENPNKEIQRFIKHMNTEKTKPHLDALSFS
ncbi:phytase [Hathewaya histolytica]|uniref:Exported protein n=1 Tax=Hathewaya histolytica TaxID=1498 RepID=A0A4U9RXN0_HATHI|nr:phytase [Hathewaya histolytica]VTQ95893.1 exported protein [Hathewaya histolytica]